MENQHPNLITIGVPTRDRPAALARLLASLHAQTYPYWDLVIVDDSSGDMLDGAGKMLLGAIELNHRIEVVEGVRINQAYSHNRVLWSHSVAPRILRLDDDLILSPDYLEILDQTWSKLVDDGVKLGAVSGIIFTEHLRSRDEYPPVATSMHPSTEVGIRGEISPDAYIQEYSDGDLIPAQHLYSSCLYSRDAMRQVGGWPLIYSKGVSYHEESDGTFRLHLAGYKMFVVPDARAQHSHEGIGGTRMMSPTQHRRQREEDWKRFVLRTPLLRGVPSYVPSVALCSQHCQGLGGGQRLTYTMLDVLQELVRDGFLQRADLYPLNNEQVESREAIQEVYGLDVEVEHGEPPEFYDVVISLGHKPPDPETIPVRRFHIHYSLFAMDGELPQMVDRYVAISELAVLSVRKRYQRNAEAIYPFVIDPRLNPADITKDKIILIVGRLEDKGVFQMAEAFTSMDLPEGTRLHIVAPARSRHESAIAVTTLAQKHDDIELHIGLNRHEMQELYASAVVLWAGRGYGAVDPRPEYSLEHFGYTPVEALVHFCVPVAYDAGGYQETTLLRWLALSGLQEITAKLLEDREFWMKSLQDNRQISGRFSREQFRLSWQRVILSSNGLAWDPHVEWRMSEPRQEITVESHDRHVLVAGGHPQAHTGYGVVMQQVARGLVDAGLKVHIFAVNDHRPDVERRYASLCCSPEGADVDRLLRSFARSREFDAALVMYDPSISRRFLADIRVGSRYFIPTAAYVTQDGAPAHPDWEAILAQANVAGTYSRSAARVIKEQFDKDVEWAYPGVDHAPFRRFDDGDRALLRRLIGWEGRFIIFYVGRNVRNKNLARLMKVIKLLRRTDDSVHLILHTESKPKQIFHGIDVERYAKMLGFNKGDAHEVLVLPVPEDGIVPYEMDVDEWFRRKQPRGARERHEWLAALPMIGRYNLADLYLDLSSAEGFGLPTLEAMACGIPTFSVDDGLVRTETLASGAHLLTPASVVDEWITGADLKIVDPSIAASSIGIAQLSPTALIRLAEAGQRVSWKYTWDTTRKKILEWVERCLEM